MRLVKNVIEFIIVFLCCILLYPIIVYVGKTYINLKNLPLIPYHYYIQVWLSFPLLILLGLVEFFKFKRKVFGISIAFIGFLWFLAVFLEIYSKNNG